MTNRPKPPLKEAARSVLSAAPSRALLRAITTNRRLSYEHRRWVYLRLGKKVRQDEATKFEHSSGTTTLKFHLQGIARELYWVGEYEPDSLPLFVEYARTAPSTPTSDQRAEADACPSRRVTTSSPSLLKDAAST